MPKFRFKNRFIQKKVSSCRCRLECVSFDRLLLEPCYVIVFNLNHKLLSVKIQAVLKLSKLMPRNIDETDSDDENELVKLFINYFSFQDCNVSELELKSELSLWKSKWTRGEKEGKYAIKSLDAITSAEICCEVIYSNIKRLLLIIACLPISVASAERSFSTLRRLKTWLRSKMGKNRLCGLALLNIHREIEISIEDIIQQFAKMKKRHTDLIL